MYTDRRWQDEDDAATAEANRQTAGLVGIVIVLMLLIAGLFLVHQLRTTTLIEDCLMSGRHDCDIYVTAEH